MNDLNNFGAVEPDPVPVPMSSPSESELTYTIELAADPTPVPVVILKEPVLNEEKPEAVAITIPPPEAVVVTVPVEQTSQSELSEEWSAETLRKMAEHLRKVERLKITIDQAKEKLLNDPTTIEKYKHLKNLGKF